MARPFSEEVKEQWKEKILKQRQSKLSLTAWCRQSGVAIHTFYYWQRKLFPEPCLNRADFTESANEIQSSTGIILEYQNFKIHLQEDFNSSILRQCLEVLKKC
jgi:hypothetical protein